MFYSYDLSIERQSSATTALALSTASSAHAAATTRSGPSTLHLSATSLGHASPVKKTTGKLLAVSGSRGFSSGFGSGFGLFGSPSITTLTAARSGGNLVALSVAAASAAHAVARRSRFVALFVASPSVVVALVPQLGHAVLAVAQSATTGLGRRVSKSTAATHSVVAGVIRSFLRQPSTTSTSSSGLLKLTGLLRSVASIGLASSTAVPSGTLHSFLVSRQSLAPRSIGRGITVASAEASRVSRSFPSRLNGVIAGVGRLVRSAVYSRTLAAASAQAASERRGLASFRIAVSPTRAGALKGISLLRGLSTAVPAGASRSAGKLQNAAANEVTALQRSTGKPVPLRAFSSVRLQSASFRFVAALSSALVQAASVVTHMAHNIAKSAATAQSMAASLSVITVRLLLLNSSNAQFLRTRHRLIMTALSAVAPSAQALSRLAGKVLGTASVSPSVVQVTTQHALLRAVATISAVFSIASRARVLPTAQAQVAAERTLRGKVLGAISTSGAFTIKALFQAISVRGLQSINVGRAIGRMSAAATTEAAASARGLFRSFSAVSTEAAKTRAGRGFAVGSITGSASSLRRLTAKGASAFLRQITNAGRVDSKTVHATTPAATSSIASRGVIMRAVQQLISQAKAWYYLFVAEWAYQQTVLLPAGGGVAQPPSFGPIDPQDATFLAFDWSSRANPGDAIISAAVTSDPPGLVFGPQPILISGTLVRVTVAPVASIIGFSGIDGVPPSFSLRCSAVFASGRVSNFSVALPIRTL